MTDDSVSSEYVKRPKHWMETSKTMTRRSRVAKAVISLSLQKSTFRNKRGVLSSKGIHHNQADPSFQCQHRASN